MDSHNHFGVDTTVDSVHQGADKAFRCASITFPLTLAFAIDQGRRMGPRRSSFESQLVLVTESALQPRVLRRQIFSKLVITSLPARHRADF